MATDGLTLKPFTLVLAGGGARGLAHVGVLRALEYYGYRPDAVIGISMGAIVATTYALNNKWYEAILRIPAPPLSLPARPNTGRFVACIPTIVATEIAVHGLTFG